MATMRIERRSENFLKSAKIKRPVTEHKYNIGEAARRCGLKSITLYHGGGDMRLTAQ